MAIYKYRAKKGPQELAEGRVEAQSEKEAIEKVSQLGYIPVRIEADKGSAFAESRAPFSGGITGKLRSAEVTIFSRQLSSLLKSGVPILTALNIIAEQSENPGLKAILRKIHNAVKDGATFSSVLSQYPKVFSPLYIALIRTGEDSGTLSGALLRIADYRAKQEEMISRLRMALAYPVLMAIVGLGTVIFMLTFVMPRLMRIFTDMGQNLPLPTRILISTSQGLRQWGIWIIPALFLVIFIVSQQTKKETGRLSLSKLKLRLPVFGKFILKAELGRFCRTLELLIKSGIPIIKALDIAIPVLDSEVIKNHLQGSYKELEEGGSFGRSLKNSRLFPVFMSNLIIVGEESGKLEQSLSEVATYYELETDEAMRVMGSLLEPLMILAMGLVVGFIVMAMLLPIFEINVIVK